MALKTTIRANGEVRSSKRQHISDKPFTLANWYEHINWLNTTVTVIIPIIGLIAAYFTPLHRATLVCAIAYYFITGLGITAGATTPLSQFS
jgi:stearoyl-CoA desaturase (Delta-9 desaturase)